MEKIKIELHAYNAFAILSFLREFINENTRDKYGLKALQDAVNEYEWQVLNKSSLQQIEDAIVENKVNILIGKSPDVNGIYDI